MARGPILAAKIGPAGPFLAAKVVLWTTFGRFFCQNWSGQTDFGGDRFWHDSTTNPIVVVLTPVTMKNLSGRHCFYTYMQYFQAYVTGN